MSYYKTKSPAERKAWGAKMAAARAAKSKTSGGQTAYRGRGAYYKYNKNTGQMAKKKFQKSHKSEGQIWAKQLAPALAPLITAGLSAAGTVVGGPALGAIGGLVGMAGDAAMKYFSGTGDYQVRANSLLQGSKVPVINHDTHGGQVFRGSEYLGDIISSPTANTFQNQSFSINAALEQTFPKLSQQACNYEQYIIEGMYFEYRPMSGNALNSVNTALGQVVMACNYNATAPAFKSKQAMEEYEGGCSIMPSQGLRFFVECARSQTPIDILYTRSGAVPGGQDPRLYDLGTFQIATNAMQGMSVNLGELWVTYQVCCLKSKLFSGFGNYNSGLIAQASYNNTNTINNGSEVGAYNSGGFGLGTNFVNLPLSPLPQSYSVIITWVGAAFSSGPVSPVASMTNGTFPFGGTGTSIPNNNSNVGNMTTVGYTAIVTANANQQAALLLTGGGSTNLPTSGTCFVQVWQIPNLATGI